MGLHQAKSYEDIAFSANFYRFLMKTGNGKFIIEVDLLETKCSLPGRGLEFDMKYHILHDFRTSTPLQENSSDRFKDLHKLELLKNFDVNLRSSLN